MLYLYICIRICLLTGIKLRTCNSLAKLVYLLLLQAAAICRQLTAKFAPKCSFAAAVHRHRERKYHLQICWQCTVKKHWFNSKESLIQQWRNTVHRHSKEILFTQWRNITCTVKTYYLHSEKYYLHWFNTWLWRNTSCTVNKYCVNGEKYQKCNFAPILVCSMTAANFHIWFPQRDLQGQAGSQYPHSPLPVWWTPSTTWAHCFPSTPFIPHNFELYSIRWHIE